jgi:RNA polymerase sigma factor (TIGR02999 family)
LTDHEVTRLLQAAASGDDSAMGQLMPLIYDELRSAARRLVGSRAPVVQPTALVHDAYLKLYRYEGEWDGRRHFLCVAAKAMRQILADRARELRTEKRGGAWRHVTLDEAAPGAAQGATNAINLIELDNALAELAEADERSATIVEMRFLAGMTIEQVAQSLGISATTVKDDWRAARAWLHGRLAGQGS